VNVEQASKIMLRKPKRVYARGRPPSLEGSDIATRGSAGVVTTACTEGSNTQHGKPHSAKGRDLPRTPARDRPGRLG
jgi:hypothetical protein